MVFLIYTYFLTTYQNVYSTQYCCEMKCNPLSAMYAYLLWEDQGEFLYSGPHMLLQTPPVRLHHELLCLHTPAMLTLAGTSSGHA